MSHVNPLFCFTHSWNHSSHALGILPLQRGHGWWCASNHSPPKQKRL